MTPQKIAHHAGHCALQQMSTHERYYATFGPTLGCTCGVITAAHVEEMNKGWNWYPTPDEETP